jgi:hypothetical protein
MPNYTNTIIYKLINYDYPDLVYVGSTTNYTKRKQQHKQLCHNEKSDKHNLKVYVNIRENGGWKNWSMIKICDYPCNNKREAELEEDRFMMIFKANMNCNRASRTKKQYCKDNREKIQEYRKEYYETNKEKIQEYNKEYRDNNKDYYKEYHKEYRNNNKEHLKNKIKEYREDNREKIKEKLKEKVTCKCGCVVTTQNIKRHEINKKHINLMNKLIQ